MKGICFVAKLLMIIGALNWGLVGFFGYDLVADLFGGASKMGARVVYDLIGLAGLLAVARLFGCCGGKCHCGPNCNCCHKK